MEAFTLAFPELANDDARLRIINEDEMKSPDGKARWRAFMMPFEGKGSPPVALCSFACIGC